MICHINSFMHEVAVLGYDALSLDIWFPKFQGKADISASKSEMCLSPLSFPILYAVFCSLLSLIGYLTLLISQSPITQSLYIHVVACSLVFFLDISNHKDETTTMCQNISDAAQHPRRMHASSTSQQKAKNLHIP